MRIPAFSHSCYSWFAPVLLVTLPFSVTAAEPTLAQKLVLSNRALVIAHRGNSCDCPENTLPAFQSAMDAKADLVELDYHHSADDVPVVIHDEMLDRTTDSRQVLGGAELLIGKTTLQDLLRLDAGVWFDDKFAKTRLPTLAESLDLIQAGSTALIERKAGDAKTLIRLLEEKKLTEQVVVQSFDWQFVAECRRLSPRLALATLSGKPASEQQIRAAAATGADLIVWNHEKIGRQQIDLIHSLGKRAWVYTVDDPKRAKDFLAAGIDGIITNQPAEMIRIRTRSAELGTRNDRP